LALLANTAATVAVLATLIALLGPISGAHFNPAVSIVEALRRKLTPQQAVAYVMYNRRLLFGRSFSARDVRDAVDPGFLASAHGPAQWCLKGSPQRG